MHCLMTIHLLYNIQYMFSASGEPCMGLIWTMHGKPVIYHGITMDCP
jgi:hypothetical protein